MRLQLRVAGALLAVVGIWVLLALQPWVVAPFTIDDAGISFAYAKNLAAGFGPVAYPGGEWVEGFSDPLWVGLLAVLARLGLDVETGSKGLGLLCGALTLPLAWAMVVQARDGRSKGGALLAPWLLATSSTWTIWAMSGLENALFGLLLLAGTLSLSTEGRQSRGQWCALACYLLLALTRPEGAVYGLIAWGVATQHDRSWRSRGRPGEHPGLVVVPALSLVPRGAGAPQRAALDPVGPAGGALQAPVGDQRPRPHGHRRGARGLQGAGGGASPRGRYPHHRARRGPRCGDLAERAGGVGLGQPGPSGF